MATKTTGTTNKGALDNSLSYDEKERLMVLSVLREECGRELRKKAHYADEEFDWKEHNAEFNEDYGNSTTAELLKLCKYYYGLSSLDAVRERRAYHRNQFAARTNKD